MKTYKEENTNIKEDFIIENTTLVEYKGMDKDVVIPNGITNIKQEF